VADVVLGAENYDTDVRFSGQKAIFMGVWVLPTSNSLDVIKAVREELPDIEKQLPTGMHVHLSYDATGYIRDALHEVLHTLSETLLDRHLRDLSVSWQLALHSCSRGRHPALARRRAVPDPDPRILRSTCSRCWRLFCPWASSWMTPLLLLKCGAPLAGGAFAF
jgi:hypothetical protein